MPFFSIIIPVYNVAPYLRECLDSVLAQTFTDWEAICVDDGSTDGSGAILDEYAAKDSRFQVFHQKNTGVGKTRNAALDKTKGAWICFLDADDVWNRFLLAHISSLIDNYPGEELFRFKSEFFSSQEWSGKSCKLPVYNVCRKDISKEISVEDFLGDLFVCYVYRADLVIGIRFPMYIKGEDWCFLNGIKLEWANHIIASDAILYGYRQRAGSAMHKEHSTQAFKDEMAHRVMLVDLVDNSRKIFDYSKVPWLVDYFVRKVPRIIYRRNDFNDLYKFWMRCVKRLLQAKHFSGFARLRLLMVYSVPFRWIRHIVFLIWFRHMEPLKRFYRKLMRHGEFANL